MHTCIPYTCIPWSRWGNWHALLAEVSAALNRDIAAGTLLSTSVSFVYLLVFPVPDQVLLRETERE